MPNTVQSAAEQETSKIQFLLMRRSGRWKRLAQTQLTDVTVLCSTSMNKELWDPQRGDWFCLEEAQTLKDEWKLQGFIRQRHGGQRRKSWQRMSEKRRPGGRKSMVWDMIQAQNPWAGGGMEGWIVMSVQLGSLAPSSEKSSLVSPCRTDSFSSPVTHHALYKLPNAQSQPRALAQGVGCSFCLECSSLRYLQVTLTPVLQASAQSSPSLRSHLWTCFTGANAHTCAPSFSVFFSIVFICVYFLLLIPFTRMRVLWRQELLLTAQSPAPIVHST